MQNKQFDNGVEVTSEQSTPSCVGTNSANKDIDISLKESYGSEFNTHLLEQYKLYVEMADRVSSRRVQIGSFYISILSALLALLSITTSNKDLFQGPQSFVLLTVAILGLCLCFAWAANINSYKQLNSLKFKVIHEIETHLPFPCYDREWKVLKEDKHSKRYLRLTSVEQYIPIIIAIPYLCLFVYALIKIVNP